MRRKHLKSLGTTIAIGFGVVLVLHLVVAIVGHVGIRDGRTDLLAIDGDRRVAEDMVQVDQLLRDVQQSVLIYAFTGNASSEVQVDRLYVELAELLATLDDERMDAGELADLQAILERYREHFEAARVDRSTRRGLVEALVAGLGPETAVAINQLEDVLVLGAGDSRADQVQREYYQA